MRRARIAVSATLASLALWACSSAPDTPAPPAPKETEAPTNPGTNAPGPSGDGLSATFHETVEPILQAHCQKCHRDGGIAPFALTGYDAARAHGPSLLAAVSNRTMPPWGAYDDEACRMNHAIMGDERLSDAEVLALRQWVEGGMPEGSPAGAPPPVTFAPMGLEGTTHEYGLPLPFTVKAGQEDDMRCFPIDPKLEQDTWFSAGDVLPGNSKIVHHVIVFQDGKGEGAAKVDGTGSYPCFGGPQVSAPSLVLAWAPGNRATTYGPEAGILLRKGTKLVVQMHYHAAHHTEETDQTRFQLRALAEPPRYAATVVLLGNASGRDSRSPIKLEPGPGDPPSGPEFRIPADVKGHTETMTFTVPARLPEAGVAAEPLRIAAVGTHMHWAGVDMKIELERAASTAASPARECLLGTPRYDFNWQRTYSYVGSYGELPVLTAGDTLRFTCTYDNTTGNRYVRQALAEKNLSSPVDIHLGETTLDEMCVGALVLLQPITATPATDPAPTPPSP